MGLFNMIDGLGNAIGTAIAEGATNAVKTSINKKKTGSENEKLKAQAENEQVEHQKLLAEVLSAEKDSWLQRKKHYVVKYMMVQSMEGGFCERNFQFLDNMPAEYRHSKEFDKCLKEIVDEYEKFVCELYQSGELSTATGIRIMSDLKYFSEISEQIDHTTSSESYFRNEAAAASSVLTGKSDIAAYLDTLKAKDFSAFAENVSDFMAYLADGIGFAEEKDYHNAVDSFLLAGRDIAYISGIKESLLYLALENFKDETNITLYETFTKMCKHSFGFSTPKKIDGVEKAVLLPCVDMIIAEAIRYASSGSTDKFTAQLEEWLDECGKWIDREQYEILQEVFVYLNAYELERTLLEKMVTLDVSRTPEQEKRLSFLKGNQVSAFASQSVRFSGTPSDVEKGTLLYDHRILTWNTNDVQQYFDTLTLKHQKQDAPIVVDEWNKDVSIAGIKWDCSKMIDRIAAKICENFGDALQCQIVEAGAAATGWIDTIPTIHVYPQNMAKHRELSFLLTGDQLTNSQVHLSIMVLLDHNTADGAVEENSALCLKAIAIKEKHNPRLEAYINTVKNILIEQLETWANDAYNSQDIY